jgi:predicted patatin/cPLA2 family phospholipase
MPRTIGLLFVCLLIAACGSTRSEKGTACLTAEPEPPPFVPAAPITPGVASLAAPPRYAPSAESQMDMGPGNQGFMRNLMSSIESGNGPYRVLALSAGGQWGAYGAGVMAGLSATNSAPAFDMVTGISTGALLAPLIFLGEYAIAKAIYTNISNDDVFWQRSRLKLLTANSIVDTTPLRRRVGAIIDDAFVERVAAEGRQHRILAVQSVNIDAGTSVVFDLTAIAMGTDRRCGAAVSARDCIIHAVMAASAIPVAFPPEFINGDMFVDGGLRQHAFALKIVRALTRRPQQAARAMAAPAGSGIMIQTGGPAEEGVRPIDLWLIANTDFKVNPVCTDNGLLNIASRSAGIAIDQLSIGSFYRLISETLGQEGSTARFTYADPMLTGCDLSGSQGQNGVTDVFNKRFMRCLFRAGCGLASQDAPQRDSIWHRNPDDLPQSPGRNAARRPGAAVTMPLVPEICAVDG